MFGDQRCLIHPPPPVRGGNILEFQWGAGYYDHNTDANYKGRRLHPQPKLINYFVMLAHQYLHDLKAST